MPYFLPSPPRETTKKGRSVGGFLSNLAGDIPQLAKSVMIDLPVAAGRGIGYSAADIARGEPGRVASRLGATGRGIVQGVEAVTPEAPKWLPGKNFQIVGYDPEKGWRFWYDDPEETQAGRERFIESVYDDPFITALNLLPGVGGATRAGSIAKISGRLAKEYPTMRRGERLRFASAESSNPGTLAAHGLKGGIEPRTLTIDVEGGRKRSVTLPRSGSPLGRSLEAGYDRWGRGPLAEGPRAARFERRLGKERMREDQAKVAGIAKPITDIAYQRSREGKLGRLGGFLMGEQEKTPSATALTAALQLPKEMNWKESLKAYLTSREQLYGEKVYAARVYSTLDDLDNDRKYMGMDAAYENPSARPVWKIREIDSDGNVVLDDGTTVKHVHSSEVYPLEAKKVGGKVRYLPPHTEPVHIPDESLKLIRAEAGEIERFLKNPPSEEKFAKAMKSMERIAGMVEDYGFFINSRHMTLAQRRKLRHRYERRKQLIINDLVARGLIPEGSEALGYFPHFSIWRNMAANWTGPVRLPSSGLVVGKTQLRREFGRTDANRLILHQLGQVQMDPAVLLYLLAGRMRYAETFQLRKDYWDIAVPLDKLKDGSHKGKGGYLIRNPDSAARSIADRVKAELNISEDEWERLVQRGEDTATALDDPEAVGAQLDEWLVSEDATRLPEWHSEKGVRWLPADIVEARFGSRVNRGETAATLGLLNALARLTLIVGRPLRYALSNIPTNVVMLAATHPGALLEAAKLMGRRWPEGMDDELIAAIRAQSGEVKATAGIFKPITQRVRPMERAEEFISRETTRLADTLGNTVDDPFRIGAWMARAKRMGFDTPDDWRRLLAKPDELRKQGLPNERIEALTHAREQLRQRTRDDLLDFDSLTQIEREQATRFLFVWPYLRAAAKWPAVYARERPVATGLMAGLAESAPEAATGLPFTSGQGSSEVEIGGKRFDLAQLNPLSVAAESAGTWQSLAHGDLSALGDYLTPTYGVAESALGGRRTPQDLGLELVGSFLPFVGPAARNAVNKGITEALLEEGLRFTPRHAFRSTRRDKTQERADIEETFPTALDNINFRRSFDAYWHYRDVSQRLRLVTQERYGRQKLNVEEQHELLRDTWERFFPGREFPAPTPSEASNDALTKIMFGLRAYLAHGLPE